MRVVAKRGAARIVSSSSAPAMRGLGDLVAKVADPIAKAIHLDKSKCGCVKRQEWLNAKVPFGPRPDA